MPIYEYKCGGCGRRVSLFFPSFSAAESRTAAGENRCPRCGSADLSRLMSRVRSLRSGNGGDDGTDDDFPDMPGGLGGYDSDPLMDGLEGLDDEDPRTIARWARQMKESMGEELDMGPEFDRALARIEAGEDPDKVMDDMDPEALAGGAMDDEALSEPGLDDFEEA